MTTWVTDPAGRGKVYFPDAFGDLREVSKPKPGGGQYVTSYTYTSLGQLATASMTRESWKNGVSQNVRQTRTFTYYNDGSLATHMHPGVHGWQAVEEVR